MCVAGLRMQMAGPMLAITLGIAGCGAAGSAPTASSASSAATASSSAMPVPTVPYIAIGASSANSGPLGVVEIIDLSGRVVASSDLGHNGVIAGATVAGVGSRGVYIREAGGTLSRLQVDGTLHPLGALPGQPSDDVAGLAESPDGSRWAYSVVSFSSSDGNVTATSRIYIGAEGASPVLAATLTRPNLASGFGGGYRVMRWDPAGLLLGTDPTGVGGLGPFIGEGYARASVVRMDPLTATLSSPLAPSGCQFGDVAGDGSVACSTRSGIQVIRPDGTSAASTLNVTTPAGADFPVRAGGLAFLGGSTSLLYLVDTPGAGNGDPAVSGGWTDTVYTAHVAGSVIAGDQVVATGNNVNEAGNEWADVIDAGRLAVIDGPDAGSNAVVVTLSTGATRNLGPAEAIYGVVHAPA
jgi:hypothetical protein